MSESPERQALLTGSWSAKILEAGTHYISPYMQIMINFTTQEGINFMGLTHVTNYSKDKHCYNFPSHLEHNGIFLNLYKYYQS